MEESEMIEDEEIEQRDIIADPTRKELEKVIGKNANGKSPGKDGINIELIKYEGNELKERLFSLIQNIWKKQKNAERVGNRRGDKQSIKKMTNKYVKIIEE
ncbi:unnamed protein product [Psylliodes chrysocephalus]|uniref:Uncharacterized protein n=1 Tax=Psylliodes chrysocephalus TaxID=3402493 RepID=A0A9P0CTE4_9CUCU|nr:unnamed protein product [Psylliodes chrysocephala]